jgi:hypothetical protein
LDLLEVLFVKNIDEAKKDDIIINCTTRTQRTLNPLFWEGELLHFLHFVNCEDFTSSKCTLKVRYWWSECHISNLETILNLF